MIKVLIADDQELMRQSLQIILGMEMRLAIKDVGEGHVVSSPGSNIHC